MFCNDFELFLTSLELYEVFCAASSATTIALISLCRSAHCSDLSKSYSMRAASGARILPFCNCGSSNRAQRILHYVHDKGDLMQ